MNKRYFRLSLIALCFLLTACTTSPGQNKGGYLTKEQVLEIHPDADYFEFQNGVYVTGIDWIEDELLTKDGEIGKNTEGMSNHLPVGAKIIAPKERRDILIVEYDELEKRYLLQLGE
ncbi:hypothetical protein [Sporosarcina obsidiansis]|uniref:hypothetical protein n=1 Tax=Sporosarcina obsidiansis TaxID=2660748 RepID=UPI00129AA04C|nr:hypothetical protein [Sporosarcina obsidiansis]